MCTATIATITARPRFEKSELRRLIETLLFAAALLFVGAVSVYDGYLVIRTGDEIVHFEKNPVGLYLIQINHGDPTAFLAAKGVGTLLVLAGLTLLYRRSPRLAVPVASALILFQGGLLIFLERARG
jgi:hypothetical protein